MTDAEIIIPRFGHYVTLASTLGALPGGLVYTFLYLVAFSEFAAHFYVWLYCLNLWCIFVLAAHFVMLHIVLSEMKMFASCLLSIHLRFLELQHAALSGLPLKKKEKDLSLPSYSLIEPLVSAGGK